VLTDSLAVKQSIDRALGEDIPIKMVYDLTATFAQQMQVEGVVATQKVSEAIQKEYGLDAIQADIVAGAAAAAFGGISKAGKGSALPTPTATTATNGLSYQSNPKHTPGQQGYSFNAGTEPKNSIDLFGSSVVSGKKDILLMLKEMFINLRIQMMELGIGLVVQVISQFLSRKAIYQIV
jgi:filamentous hemagglutinin